MFHVGYFWAVVTALVAVTIATPAQLTSRSVSSEVLQQLDLFSQYSAASYCSNNVDSNSNRTKVTCAAGNCKSVENASTKILYQFSEYTHHNPESDPIQQTNKQTDTNTASTGDFGDTTGFLAADTTNHLLVVAFRGSRSINNFVADTVFPQEEVEDLCRGCSVHSGIWTAWQTVADKLTRKLKSAAAEYSGYTVVVTGHSLGGALATLGATALRNDGVDVDLYTYGSLKVGNEALAEYVTTQGTLYRVTHTNDIAPKVPSEGLGFSHPGPEYWVTSGNGDTVGLDDVEVIQGTDAARGNAGAAGGSLAAHFSYFGNIYACF